MRSILHVDSCATYKQFYSPQLDINAIHCEKCNKHERKAKKYYTMKNELTNSYGLKKAFTQERRFQPRNCF